MSSSALDDAAKDFPVVLKVFEVGSGIEGFTLLLSHICLFFHSICHSFKTDDLACCLGLE